MRLAFLFCLASGLSFAGTWSGSLVDARCWMFAERNVSPRDTSTFVDRDRNQEVAYCTPSPKTKTFAIVPPDGVSLAFDDAGNKKAAELVRNAGKIKSPLRVVVNGQEDKNGIQVSSISPAP